MSFKVFIRQPFTESGQNEQQIVQSVLDIVLAQQPELDLDILTPKTAQTADSFKKYFETTTGQPFSPQNFRKYRLSLINKADAFINIRASMSESSAFEIAYNIFKGNNIPVFFAVWENAPIKTTLLRDLQDLCDVEYHTFSDPQTLAEPIEQFLKRVHSKVGAKLAGSVTS